MNPEIVGTAAGILSSVTFVPQIARTFRTKSAEDVSPLMFVLAFVSTILWITYGIMKDSFSVLYTNIVVLVLSVIMLILKVKYKKH